jgi:hypothetical protein
MIFLTGKLTLIVENIQDIEALIEKGIITDIEFEQAKHVLLEQLCKGEENGGS